MNEGGVVRIEISLETMNHFPTRYKRRETAGLLCYEFIKYPENQNISFKGTGYLNNLYFRWIFHYNNNSYGYNSIFTIVQ